MAKMRLLSCLTVILLLQCTVAKQDAKGACVTCKQITDNFQKGVERTAKAGFGGGNTAWEERKLSKYETSEIRLVEILESLCDSSSFECNNMVEEHEEHFEDWWFKRQVKHPDLHQWFCIDTIHVCCPSGTFGASCKPCVGGAEKPCHGRGACDGDGTRGGKGTCSCHDGYTGELCLDCKDGFFNEVRNNTYSLCTDCHDSCQTCSGPTNADCEECKRGWEEDDEGACLDVDECSKDPARCREDEYCLNSEGSYACKVCDWVCSGCSGAGPDKCKACSSGYHNVEGTCTDVDECSAEEQVCTKENQECVNTRGSYTCVCASGHQEEEGECIKSPEPDVEEEMSEPEETETADTVGHDDL